MMSDGSSTAAPSWWCGIVVCVVVLADRCELAALAAGLKCMRLTLLMVIVGLFQVLRHEQGWHRHVLRMLGLGYGLPLQCMPTVGDKTT
jgi:hypothetical protein